MKSCREALRIDGRVADAPPRDDRQAKQRDLFRRHRPAGPAVPVRIAVAAGDQVRRQRLDPVRVDAGDGPQIAPRRFDHLRRHDPLGLAGRRAAARPEQELAAAGCRVFVRLAAVGDARQAGRRGASGGWRRRRRLAGTNWLREMCRVTSSARVTGPGLVPATNHRRFPAFSPNCCTISKSCRCTSCHSRSRSSDRKFCWQALRNWPRVVWALSCCTKSHSLSQPRKSESGSAHWAWASVGLLLPLGRPVARVLHFERRRDDQHVGQALLAAGLEDHPADPRIDRQSGQLPAERQSAGSARRSPPARTASCSRRESPRPAADRETETRRSGPDRAPAAAGSPRPGSSAESRAT